LLFWSAGLYNSVVLQIDTNVLDENITSISKEQTTALLKMEAFYFLGTLVHIYMYNVPQSRLKQSQQV
jgi:hypothetical protein